MHKVTKRAGVSVLAVVLALGLSGCANPLESLVEKVIEDAVGDQLGGDIDINQDGGTISFESDEGKVQLGEGSVVPASFPSRLPLPNASLQAAVDAPGQWTLTYAGVDRAELDRVVASLGGSGFAEESLFNSDEMYQGNFKDHQFTVTLIWGKSDDSAHLIYGVSPLN